MPAPPKTPARVSRDPRAGVVAPRPRPRPRDAPVGCDARRAGGTRGGHDRDRRPPLQPERARRQPRRHRPGVRRGGRARRVLLRGHRPQRRRRRQGRARRERAVPAGRRPRARRRARVVHPLRRDARRGVRPRGRPRRRRARPRRRGPVDAAAGARLEGRADDRWILAHAVHLDRALPGTVVHNPRSNLNNAVGYGRPARFDRVALGTDGIGADMLEEFRARVRARARRRRERRRPSCRGRGSRPAPTSSPRRSPTGSSWSYEPMDPWYLAYTPGVRPIRVEVGGRDGARRARPDPRRCRPRSGPVRPSRPAVCTRCLGRDVRHAPRAKAGSRSTCRTRTRSATACGSHGPRRTPASKPCGRPRAGSCGRRPSRSPRSARPPNGSSSARASSACGSAIPRSSRRPSPRSTTSRRAG